MNRREIQKSFKRICPPKSRYEEKQDPEWFERVARELRKHDVQWETKTVRNLWKDERCSFYDWMGVSIRKALTAYPPAHSAQVTSKLRRLQESQIRDEDVNKIIGDKVNEIIHTALANYLASNKGVSQRTTG